MGRRVVYTKPPRRPRMACLAWDYFYKERGAPLELYFDGTDGYWVGMYPAQEGQAEGGSLEFRVPQQNIEGIKERKLVER